VSYVPNVASFFGLKNPDFHFGFHYVYAIRLQHIGVNIRMIRLKNHCGAPDFFPNFSKICVAQFFVFVVVFCGPLSVQITTVMH